MYKSRWRYLVVAIAVTIVFLANTVNAAFSPIIMRKVEASQNSSVDKSSISDPMQSSNGFYSNLQDKSKRTSETVGNFWGFNNFDKSTRFDAIGEHGDLTTADGNSTELVIGVDSAKPQAYTSLVDAIRNSQGKIINKVLIDGKVIAIVAYLPPDAVLTFKESVQKIGLTRYIAPRIKYQALFVPNDPYWSMQWGPQKIEADWAWNTTTGNHSVLVAVIDTGIDYTHPDLAENYVALGYDWVNGDSDPLDDFGHGTHCAGTIAAVINNSIGIAGVANVRIMAEKGLDAYGSGWDDDLANAIIDAVDQGADIISNSWGGYEESNLIYDAVQYAYNHGVLVIAAAGNDATNQKLYPAAYEEVVAVTATDSYDDPAYFTNFGDWVEVAAPGMNIYSTMPTYPVTLNDYGYSMNYDYMSGTSMACPHAAGVAALIWSQFPSAARDWVRTQLRGTAEDLGDPDFDEYYGYGRINAKNAVEQTPPDHDLLIFDWKKPTHIQPGDTVSLDATVLNFGANDEQDVTVQLLVDETLTDSTTISHLANSTSTTVSLSWNPLVEATYNVTLYIVPVSGETETENNVVMEMILVRYAVGFVLLDQAHNCDPIDWYSVWIENLTDRGYFVDTYTASPITPDVLAWYDIFVIPQAWNSYSSDEISAIQDFVLNGGGLLVIGDDYPSIYTSLTSFADITWGWYYEWSGYTNNITPHDVTEGVSTAFFGAPLSELFVSSSAEGLIQDGYGYGDIMLAIAEMEAGRVVCVADEDTITDWSIDYVDNFRLANNMIDWLLGVKYQHELLVRLDAPSYLAPDESLLLNATVYNSGLNNETDVELRLLINDTMVKNETVPLLVNGTKYTMNYTWTSSVEAIYDVTAYAPPVPDENVTLNNMATKFVIVQYPLINPVSGHYANYIIKYYDPSGNLVGAGYMNFTYEYYVEPYKIYITAWQKVPSGDIYTGWMIVNTMNRLVESGNVWTGLWYPGWIETDINIGSTINLLDGSATVNGTRMVVVGPRAIDCWEIPYSMYGYAYSFWHDKASGLWIMMETIDPYSGTRIELLLACTNVPIGAQYEHDLGVTVDAPLRLQPRETSILNATVYNLGLNNESNVEIRMLINGTEVEGQTLPNLFNGTWYTINYSWTPTVEGTYNITAHAPSVPSEDVAINNIASTMVRVRYVEVALISDHSELVSIAYILDSMGIGYDIYNNNLMYLYTENLSLLLKYKAVIFYTEYSPITSNEYSTLESYLSLGGNLLVTGYDCLVSDTLLASLVRSSTTGDNVGEFELHVVDETHPIMNGHYGTFPEEYIVYGLYGDCDMVEADTTRNAVTVAELADGYAKIIATEGLPGRVVFWNGVGTYDWTVSSDCEIMLKNLIYWFTVRYQHELVVSLQGPIFLEPDDSATLNATVYNAGLSIETNVLLQLLVNGTVVKSETTTQLSSGTFHSISYLWTPPIVGKYNVTVYAPPVSGENITRNNICSRIIPVQTALRILAYVQYTDYYQEYANTLRAINSTFGPSYVLTELWNYTQLDSMIGGKDILLIPEQEYAGLYTMQVVGTAWSETLSQFLENGGILIVCDFNGGSGGTYGILTGAGLMSISWANYRTLYTLYLVDPSDPLAENVSPSFSGPDGTISFATQEENVVVDDGTYPVVIHKKIGGGHITLLGFDFWSSNANAKQILGNAVTLATYITIYISPSSGSLGTEVEVRGTKATENGTVSIYWDSIFMGTTTANTIGDFTYLLTVPSGATVGIHTIMAIDDATGRTATAPFRVLLITLNPSKGPVGTKVTVKGAGFTPKNQTTITFNDMLIGYASVDDFGNFTFTFNIPLSAAEIQAIKAYDVEGYAIATYTVVDVTTLDVQIDVGAMHFRGEIAEFFAQTTFRGQAINAAIKSAVLYKPDGTTESITAQLIAIGLYKLSYSIPVDASTGTYTLVVSASHIASTVEAEGTSFKCFLISQTLTNMDLIIQEIQGNIATIIIPNLGTIKANLTAIDATLLSLNGTTAWIQTNLGLARADIQAINATLTSLNGTTAEIQTSIGAIQVSLEDIQLKVIAINGTTATIQTTLGIINGTITEIQGDIATIQTPLGQIQADISSLKGTQDAWIIPNYVIIVLALIAAAGATLSVIMLRRRRSIAMK